LSKNIIIKMLCPFDENSRKLIKQIVPFIVYQSIKLSPHKTAEAATVPSSLLFIRDKHDIFSFSIDVHHYDKENKDYNEDKNKNSIFTVNDWLYSKDVSLVKNSVSCFDIVWEEKENYDKMIEEKKHSDLLVDLITHDIGNYHQVIQTSLGLVIFLLEKNKASVLSLQDSEKIFSYLTTAKNALMKSRSLVDNIRRLERLYGQKDLKLILRNLPEAINNAYSTIEQTLYDNNPYGKKISISMTHGHAMDINIMAEDLLDEIFINLFSNSVKYTDSSEVKIDVMIKDYFIAEAKHWMITISDYGKGIPDSMKKELFERFYYKAKGSGLGLSIVRALVERYRGKIWVGDRVYKDYTKGTTFGMIFPAA
ncbi:MAG TPA: HAMP domain-containing sensor histidine kinase, partial [Nitrososphaeraceae archaeon]|nr:HAMP domain-containing sensor histidine kinase [Nitrososphaeraceae archaeon]